LRRAANPYLQLCRVTWRNDDPFASIVKRLAKQFLIAFA
jgi:hypothetical protein